MTLRTRIFLCLSLMVITGCSPVSQSVQPTQTPEPVQPTQTLQQVESTQTNQPIQLPPSTPDPRQILLVQNREKWKSQNITHYRFKLKQDCLCLYRDIMPVTIEVKDDKTISMVDVNDMVLNSWAYSSFIKVGTIDNLFDLIREGITTNAYIVRISYDDTFGFPVSIYIDWNKDLYDEESIYSLSNFESLP